MNECLIEPGHYACVKLGGGETYMHGDIVSQQAGVALYRDSLSKLQTTALLYWDSLTAGRCVLQGQFGACKCFVYGQFDS